MWRRLVTLCSANSFLDCSLNALSSLIFIAHKKALVCKNSSSILTGGEPTRVIVSGGPDLGSGPLSERLIRFREQFDHYRSAVVCEPRGSDVLVGALLCEPHDTSCSAGVIFFNNVGYLGMCGHGTIGLVATLAYQRETRNR